MSALASLFAKRPWLITPESLTAMAAQAVAFFDGKVKPSEPPKSDLLTIEDGIGIVSLQGPMMRHPDVFAVLFFGAVDTEQVMAAVQEAAHRDDVEAILLDIDSPGGAVNGTPELAQAVADASKEKSIYAFSAGQMCSAAYWVASQCDAIYATPSARVGSIGVVLALVDDTEAFRREGLTVEVFAAGKFKSAGLPGVSLTDEQRALLQNDVEETAGDFRRAVLARGRKIPDEAMEGQAFSARQAQGHNLAGMIKNRAEVLARLRSLHGHKVDTRAWASATMKTLDEQLGEALARIAQLEENARAHESLLTEATTQAQSVKAALEQNETAFQVQREEWQNERTSLTSQIAEAKAEAQRSLLRNQELESQNAELRSCEQDLEKRASLRAAQIAAEMGSPVPAKITPPGDPSTTNSPPPGASAAAVWNRQFQARR